MSTLSGIARAGIAAFCVGFGAFIGAAAMRWIDVPPAPGVPYWIVGLAGAVFALAGIAIALPQRATRLQDVLGALLFSAFASIGLWIGFGPGERHFGGGMSVGPVAFGGDSGDMTGRVAFGAMGVLVSLIAVAAWRRVFRPRDRGGRIGRRSPGGSRHDAPAGPTPDRRIDTGKAPTDDVRSQECAASVEADPAGTTRERDLPPD